MMDRIDLQKLRELPIEGVAQRLGMSITRHKSLCPFHDDSHPSLSFSVSRNTFRCFVCGASGGTIDLVMRYLGMDFLEACKWLAEENHVVLFRPPLAPPRSALPLGLSKNSGGEKVTFDASRYERFFERPWLNEAARRFLFEERKIDSRVVRWCRLTSWTDRQGVSWLQIPYYNKDGKLIGIQNRNLIKGATPRFRFPTGSKCSIYNLPVLNLLKPGDELYITEGCSDCWAMLSAGHKAIAIPSATLLSKADVELLQALSSEGSTRPEGALATNKDARIHFHMWPDRDEPGERLFLQLQKVLPSLVHHQLPPGCKDFGEYYSHKET